MRFIPIAVALAAGTALMPDEARACTIAVPHPPPTQAQIDANMRRYYDGAAAVVEVLAIRGSRFDQPGRMRVTRVYKGDLRAGAVINMSALPSSMCGAGDFEPGSRGIVMLPSRGPYIFQGYLPRPSVDTLRRSGRLPPR